MLHLNEEILQHLRDMYPVGCRVVLDAMDDRQAPPVGTKGTAIGVDDIGSILVRWDNESSLNVAYGADRCHRIKE